MFISTANNALSELRSERNRGSKFTPWPKFTKRPIQIFQDEIALREKEERKKKKKKKREKKEKKKGKKNEGKHLIQ